MTIKLAIAQINSIVGDLTNNSEQIFKYAEKSAQQDVDILLTPEFALVGYPPEDLVLKPSFYLKIANELDLLASKLSIFKDLYVVIGLSFNL